jgi:hypothetical protein
MAKQKKEEEGSVNFEESLKEETNIDTEYEVVETSGKSLAIRLTETEMEAQSNMAHRYPRQVAQVSNLLNQLVHLDQQAAADMLYSIPRGGKMIEGPSIRFAEALAQTWRNNRTAARVVEVNKQEGYIEAEGVFLDMETNVGTIMKVRRRIKDKYGRIYTDDMIMVTGNAACSIAKRNAIIGGIPRAVYWGAYQAAKRVAAGDISDLVKTRRNMISAFGKLDIKPDTLLRQIGVASEEGITLEHVSTLRGLYSAISSGETTKEEVFAQPPMEARAEEVAHSTKKPRKLDDIGAPDKVTVDDAQKAGHKAYWSDVPRDKAPDFNRPALLTAWLEGWDYGAEENKGDDQDAQPS